MTDNATVFPLARSLEVTSPAEKLFSSTADSFSFDTSSSSFNTDSFSSFSSFDSNSLSDSLCSELSSSFGSDFCS